MLQQLFLICFYVFHPFYVSVAEIEHNQQTKTVQVSVRIFFDDLEQALNKRYKASVNIVKPKDRKQVEVLLSAYLKEHLQLKANDTELNLKFAGYEIEEEAAWCYFESDKLAEIKKLSVKNNILYEQHSSQINMIHATVNGKRKSKKLDNPESSAEFNY